MFSRKGMSLIAVLGLLIFSVYAAAGPNANAVLSLDLIADGGAGNGADDGVTSGTVSSRGTTIAIEIFATGVRTSLIGMTLEFDFDASLLSFVKAENSAFPLTLPEGSTGTNFATRNPVTLASSGFLARAEFATVSDVTGTEFSIGIESVTLSENTTSSDELITTSVITFNASPSPDFDGDDFVGFTDFLIFASVFGSRRGDGTYEARIDLNSDGSIGFTDFLIFAQSFGSAPPSTGGGTPDLVVQSPSVSNNNVASGATFTLGATVRNQGTGSSAATTLHYYRSDDATIDATDTQVGTAAVRGLAAGRASAESINLTAPSDAGTYYYGACVDAVTGESDTGNNCSEAVSITVAAVTPPDAGGVNKMYWADGGTQMIQRSNLDGSDVEDLVTTGLDYPHGIALDVAGGKMYWTDFSANKIQRSNLDGSGVEDLVTGLTLPYAIALDVAGGKMYWTDVGADKIQRSNLDGSGIEDLVTGLTLPFAIALDVSGGKMYWTNLDKGNKVQRSNLDGSGVEDLVTGLDDPRGIALDVAGGKMYWTDLGADKIQRSNLDGSGIEDLVTTGLDDPIGIALDVPGGKMYWTDSYYSEIRRSNLDGSGLEVLVTGLNSPRQIALDSIPVEAGPDLAVKASVSEKELTQEQSFTLSVTVRNRGTDQAAATMLRYYRSDDETIDNTDTQVGTAAVNSLASLATTSHSIDLTAPANTGTYYYGACVDPVSGESNIGNNCSSGVNVAVSGAGTAVTVPDANLRAVIETALDKDSNAPITQAEMATLDSLDASEADVSVLTGLEFAANLTYLSLNDNNITNISALAKLTALTRLWLSNNSIEDISSLSKLTDLTELWLWNNQIEDISPLSGLTNLTRLSLGRNNVTDVSALSGLTNLKTLILTGNDISDLAPLAANTGLGAGGTVDVTDNPLNAASHSTHVPALQARGVSVSFVPSPVVRIPDANLRAAIEADLDKATGAPITAAEMATLEILGARDAGISVLTGLEYAANLTSLSLAANNISDLSPLSGLTNLTRLGLDHNNISDLSPLSGLTNLKWLGLDHNNISDLSPLAGLTNLKWLFLLFNNISDASPLSGLTNLTRLELWGNNISDVSPLSGLTNLTLLDLRLQAISDLSPLAGLTNLKWLFLTSTAISDVSPLAGLTNLTELHLGVNAISDVSPLSGLTNLTRLYLPVNAISDVSPLSGLTNLTRLDLYNNRIADLSPLAANSGLVRGAEVDVRGNPLSAISYSTHIPALQRRGVDLHADPNPATIEEYDTPTLVAQHDDRVVVMGVPGRLRTDPIDFKALAQVFFTHYEDAFDYLMVLSNLPAYGDNEHYTYFGIHLSVQNAVEGTGKSRYSRNHELGSVGRLNAILHFPWNEALLSGPSLHEILHSWANHAIPTAAGVHWGFSSANGQLGGFDRANLVDHGGGRYSAGDFGLFANGGNSVPYSPIELYFAGLIPPSEVPDLWVAEDGTGLKDVSDNWVYDDAGYRIFTASKVSTWSIERIVAEHGARIPDSNQSQKEFRAALILAVDPLHPPRQSTLDDLSEAVQVFTHAGKDDWSGFNFWEATGGRATLTMDGLSAYRRAGKRVAALYRVVEPEANQDGSIGCIRMDDVAWAGQRMVALPENGNR